MASIDITKFRGLELNIIQEAMKDPAFRNDLIKSPKSIIEKHFNVIIPAGITIKVIEDTLDTYTIVLPPVGTKTEKLKYQ